MPKSNPMLQAMVVARIYFSSSEALNRQRPAFLVRMIAQSF
jgi:hypothetical protein